MNIFLYFRHYEKNINILYTLYVVKFFFSILPNSICSNAKRNGFWYWLINLNEYNKIV